MLFPALAVLAGFADGTLKLMQTNGGRGVFEHYGFHALFLSAPLLATLMCYLLLQLSDVLGSARYFGPRDGDELEAIDFQQRMIAVAAGRSAATRELLLACRGVGIFAVVANAISTCDPVPVYGQDVFDAVNYLSGYLAGRIFLAYYWVYLIPLAACMAITTAVIIFKTVDKLVRDRSYVASAFAADGCGGLRRLGELMTTVVYMYLPIGGVIAALTYTHRNMYLTLQLGIVMAALIMAQLVLPFLKPHRLLVAMKQRKLEALEKLLARAEIDAEQKWRGPRTAALHLEIIAGASLYRQTSAMTTWPYVQSDAFKWLTVLLPLALPEVLKWLAG